MEEDLDKIANGEIGRSQVLSNFWKTFGEDIKKIEDVKKGEKIKGRKPGKVVAQFILWDGTFTDSSS